MPKLHRHGVRPDDGAAAAADDFATRLASAEPAVRAFASQLMARTRLAQEIDDVVQETLARALRSAHRLDPARPIEPWLRGICVRAAADRANAVRRSAAAGEEVGERGVPSDERAVDARDELARRLAELTEVQRDVLIAFHRDGFSIAEIAAERRVPAGTIKSHLHRARRALAEREERE